MNTRYLIPLFIFGALVVLFAVGLKRDPREVPSPLIDRPAPAFNLPTVHDAAKNLSQTDLGAADVTLFNVWASWCTACRQEHPFLMELAKRGEVNIYGLNYKDERDDALAWLRRFGDPYRASAFDADGRVGIDWGVYGVPETFVVDRTGTIRYKHIGPLGEEVWQKTLRPLIGRIRGGKG